MKTKVEFLKERYYQGKKRKKGDIVDMPLDDAKIYMNYKAVKFNVQKRKTSIGQMTYKALQALAKKNNLPAVGKRDELILALRAKGVN